MERAMSDDVIAQFKKIPATTLIKYVDDGLKRLAGELLDQPWYQQWLKSPFVIQVPETPVMHQMMKQLQLTKVIADFDKNTSEIAEGMDTQSIIIDTDWAALVNAESGGEWHVPFDEQAFEFKISGLRVIAIIICDNAIAHMAIIVRSPQKDWWPIGESYEMGPDKAKRVSGFVNSPNTQLANFLHSQIRAACITLDADVTTRETIRAPHAPSNPRRDRIPLPDISYHVIKLARRYRADPTERPAGEPGDKRSSPRLHFRRGHWRHYSNHKTWVKWMLVGDRDLGIVRKDYVL
jgi:hypothetical protein